MADEVKVSEAVHLEIEGSRQTACAKGTYTLKKKYYHTNPKLTTCGNCKTEKIYRGMMLADALENPGKHNLTDPERIVMLEMQLDSLMSNISHLYGEIPTRRGHLFAGDHSWWHNVQIGLPLLSWMEVNYLSDGIRSLIRHDLTKKLETAYTFDSVKDPVEKLRIITNLLGKLDLAKSVASSKYSDAEKLQLKSD